MSRMVQAPGSKQEIQQFTEDTWYTPEGETAMQKMHRAVSQATGRHKLVGMASMLMARSLVECPHNLCDTMATDGVNIYYYPSFVHGLRDKQILFVLFHEELHVVWAHHLRRDGRNVQEWNIAGDYLINDYLMDLVRLGELEFVEGMLIDSRFDKDWTIEQVFVAISGGKPKPKPPQGPGENGEGEGDGEEEGDQSSGGGQGDKDENKNSSGDDQDQGNNSQTNHQNTSAPQPSTPPPNSVARPAPQPQPAPAKAGASGRAPGEVWDAPAGVDKAAMQQKITERMATASLLEKAVGEGAGGLVTKTTKTIGEPTSWEILRSLLARNFSTDRTWSRPNRRFISQGIYLPGTIKDLGALHVCVDTSGSVGEREMQVFFTNMKGMCEQLNISIMKIACADWVVHPDEQGNMWQTINVQHGEEVTLTSRGGGGTSFDPIFSLIKETDEQINALVYMTDGYGSVGVKDPGYPVIWLTTGRPPNFRNGTFGEIIDISKDKALSWW